MGDVPLTLVLGPANSAKAGEVLGGFAAAAQPRRDPGRPTAVDADHFSRELAPEGAVLGSVLTFTGLAREIAGRAGYGARRLTPLQRERVLAQAPSKASSSRPSAPAAAHARVRRRCRRADRRAAAVADHARAVRRRDGQLGCRGPAATAVRARRGGDLPRVRRPNSSGSAASTPSCTPGARSTRSARRPGPVGDRVAVLLRVRRPAPARARRDRDARARGRRRGHGVADLRGGPLSAHRARRGGRGAPAPGRARARAAGVRGALRAGKPRRPAPPRARAVRARARADRSGNRDRVARGRWRAGRGRAGRRRGAVAASGPACPGRRSRSCTARRRTRRRSSSTCSAATGSRWRPTGGRRSTAPRSAAHCWPWPAARCSTAIARQPPRTCSSTCGARACLDRADAVDRLEAEVRRGGLRTVGRGPPARGPRAPRDRRAASRRGSRGRSCSLTPGGCWPLRTRRGRPVLDADEELDARALGTLTRALAELEELGERPTGERADRAARDARAAGRRSGRTGRGAADRPARDPRETVPRRARVRPPGERVPARAGAGAVPLGRAPPRARRVQRAAPAPARGRAGPRALPVLHERLPRDRKGGRSPIAAPTRRGTSRCPRRSWPTCPSCSPRTGPTAAGAGCSPTSCGRRRKRRPSGSWRARTRRPRAPLAGEVPSPIGSLSEVALEHVRHRQILSAGALESYAGCPVRWLVERELQPEALEPDPDPLVRGGYMHSVIEQVLRRLGGPVTRESLPRALDILDEVIAHPAARDRPGRRPSRASGGGARSRRRPAPIPRSRGARRARLAAARPRAPLRLRRRRSPSRSRRSSSATTSGCAGSSTASTSTPEGRAIVRDYKSGGARPEYQGARWALDRQLQVALYMLVVRELLGLDPVAGFYQPLGGGDLRAAGSVPRGRRGRRLGRRQRRARPRGARRAARGRARACGGARRPPAPGRARAVPGDLLARRLPVPRDLPCLRP